jgi:hypothetical protein
MGKATGDFWNDIKKNKMAAAAERCKVAIGYMKAGMGRTAAAKKAGVHHCTLKMALQQIGCDVFGVMRHTPVKDVTPRKDGRPTLLSEEEFATFKLFVESANYAGLYLSIELTIEVLCTIVRKRIPIVEMPHNVTVSAYLKRAGARRRVVRDTPAAEARRSKATPEFIAPYFEMLAGIICSHDIQNDFLYVD